MSEFGRKIRPGMPPETPAEKYYEELNKPGSDKKFGDDFPLEKVPGMIRDNEDQEEMEGIESIRSQALGRREYLTGALNIIEKLFQQKIFRHRSTLQEMFDYFEQGVFKLEGQNIPQGKKAGDKARNTIFALRSLSELMDEGNFPTLGYLKVCKMLAARLKDIETALNQPEL